MGTIMAPIVLPPVLQYIMGLPAAPREAVERTIQAAIDALDLIDGDPDTERNGDELDGSAGEDDFWPHSNWQGHPGCPIADPGGSHNGHDDDEADDGH